MVTLQLFVYRFAHHNGYALGEHACYLEYDPCAGWQQLLLAQEPAVTPTVWFCCVHAMNSMLKSHTSVKQCTGRTNLSVSPQI
jgi:hypothetical protein